MLRSLWAKIRSEFNTANSISLMSMIATVIAMFAGIAAYNIGVPGYKLANMQIEQLKSDANEAKQKSEQLERQIKAAEQSADASKELVRVMLTQLKHGEQQSKLTAYSNYQTNRPKISASIVDYWFVAGSAARHEVKLLKNGSGTVLRLRIVTDTGSVATGSLPPKFETCDLEPWGFGEGKIVSVSKERITAAKLADVVSGKADYLMRGRICYDDDQGGSYSYDYCGVVMGPRLSMKPCSCCNEETTVSLPTAFAEFDTSIKSESRPNEERSGSVSGAATSAPASKSK